MEYTTIKLPHDLIQKIDAYIKHSDDGYTSRTDVVKTAVREFFKTNGFNAFNGNDRNGNTDHK